MSLLNDSDFLPWRNYIEGSELNLNPLNLIKPFLGKSDFNKNLKGREARSCKLENKGGWRQRCAQLAGSAFPLHGVLGDEQEVNVMRPGGTLSPRDSHRVRSTQTESPQHSHTLPVTQKAGSGLPVCSQGSRLGGHRECPHQSLEHLHTLASESCPFLLLLIYNLRAITFPAFECMVQWFCVFIRCLTATAMHSRTFRHPLQ